MKSTQTWGEQGTSTHPNLPNRELNQGCSCSEVREDSANRYYATLPPTTAPGWMQGRKI